jgi:hypothetical protein
MTFTIGIVFLCLAAGLTWALTANPRLGTFAGFVFTAALAAIFVMGPHLIR